MWLVNINQLLNFFLKSCSFSLSFQTHLLTVCLLFTITFSNFFCPRLLLPADVTSPREWLSCLFKTFCCFSSQHEAISYLFPPTLYVFFAAPSFETTCLQQIAPHHRKTQAIFFLNIYANSISIMNTLKTINPSSRPRTISPRFCKSHLSSGAYTHIEFHSFLLNTSTIAITLSVFLLTSVTILRSFSFIKI